MLGISRRPLCALLAAIVATTSVGGTGAAQEPQAQVRATVNLVRLNVAVINPGGRAVPPLTIDDFRVYDNGVLQDIQLILRPEDTPLWVALLFDKSPSVRPWWRTIERAAVSFAAQLGDDDCPYMLPFSDGVGPGMWGPLHPDELRRFLQRAPSGDGTSLFDALLIALIQFDQADELAIAANRPQPAENRSDAGHLVDQPAPDDGRAGADEPPPVTRQSLLASLADMIAEIIARHPFLRIGFCDLRRPGFGEVVDAGAEAIALEPSIKAILLLSDGADTTSQATFEDVLTAARLASVPVFPVLLGSAGDNPQLERALEQIAGATGGLLTKDVSPQQLPAAYGDILAYLRSSYVLAYDPDAKVSDAEGADRERGVESWHEVRVESRRPTLRFIVRPGYYR